MSGTSFPYVAALTVYGGDLIAGGRFTHAGGVPAANVARWDGAGWTSLGSGLTGFIEDQVHCDALCVHGLDLAVAGRMELAGGHTSNFFALWHGIDPADVTGEGGVTARPLTGYPNPFAGEIRLDFTTAAEGPVSLTVHDVRGRLVSTLPGSGASRGRGSHRVRWSGMDVSGRPAGSGVYFVRLVDGEGARVYRVLKLR
jgi:hypothetical protein